MIPLSLAEIARLVGGEVHDADAHLRVTGPAFLDTRTPEDGGLFAAFIGEHVDGHDYAVRAVEAGAAAVLGSRPTGVPTIVVADVQAALQELARTALARLQDGEVTVVAITGSQGKTSVKDLLATLLATGGQTVATAGSFNNELGLPLTVLRADEHTRFLVLEMGARGIGHIAELCAVARPDVSVVLNVGKAHVGEFGSQANIAVAKGELVEALAPDGVAVLNADDQLVAAMAERTRARVLAFGRLAPDLSVEDPPQDDSLVRYDEVELDELARPALTLHFAGEERRVQLRLTGAHQAGNAAAAVAAAVAAGLPFGAVVDALAKVGSLSRWRMELHERPDGLVVLNDAYNANPDSMRAALETLAEIGRRSGRRTVAVVGEMRELGDDAPAEHAAVGRLAGELGVDLVVVGDGARAAHEANDTSAYVETVADAIAWLGKNVAGTPGDRAVVLVKASRAGGFERIAEALLRDEPEAGQ